MRFLSLAAFVSEGEDCTTIIITLFAILVCLDRICVNVPVLYVVEQGIKFLGFNHGFQ